MLRKFRRNGKETVEDGSSKVNEDGSDAAPESAPAEAESQPRRLTFFDLPGEVRD